MADATSGAGTADPSGTPEFTPGFSGVRVTRSLVLHVLDFIVLALHNQFSWRRRVS